MKLTIKYTIALIAIFSAPLASFSADKSTSKPEYQLPEYTVEDVTLPVPSKVVKPRVGAGLLGCKARMSFEISAEGRACNITQKGISPDPKINDLVATMRMALVSWEFEPALDNHGKAIAVKVIMPVEVVKKEDRITAVASLTLDNNSKRL